MKFDIGRARKNEEAVQEPGQVVWPPTIIPCFQAFQSTAAGGHWTSSEDHMVAVSMSHVVFRTEGETRPILTTVVFRGQAKAKAGC